MVNGISSVGNNQSVNRATQSRVNLPSFMLSTTEPEIGDEEFKQKIIEMAKRDQAAGRFQSNDANSEFHALRFSYISVASPDREGMINNALPTISSKIREYAAKSYNSYQEMIMDLLFGIEPLTSTNLNKGQNITLFELKDANGNLLARLSTDGWEMHSTPAENSRDAEFISIYNKAWRTAEHEQKYGSPETRRGDGWAENASIPSGATPNLTAKNITTVDVSGLQPQQGQAASQTTARYEANLHGATA